MKYKRKCGTWMRGRQNYDLAQIYSIIVIIVSLFFQIQCTLILTASKNKFIEVVCKGSGACGLSVVLFSLCSCERAEAAEGPRGTTPRASPPLIKTFQIPCSTTLRQGVPLQQPSAALHNCQPSIHFCMHHFSRT